MKKIWLFILIVQLAAAPVFSIPGSDRKRFYLISGIGYASSHPEGWLAEAGVEVQLFGNIHTRILLDYYPGREIEKDSVTLKHMYGISLYVVYKLQVSETIDFRLKVGGHYSRIRAEITALGITFTTTMADIGYSSGGGFSWQLGNKVYLYAEAAVKHLLLDEPWTWVKGDVGIMFRLR
jgi:hypothetical protein